MDIDYAIRKDEPPAITETSTPDAVDLYEKWERSNRLSVMFIKTKISAGIRGSVEHLSTKSFEREQMKNIPYASAVGSLMYAQVCTRPDIAYVIGMLGRYQSNLGLDHWKAAKKVMRYLQGTKNYMLMYRRTDNLEVIGYFDSDYDGCIDLRKSTSGYVFMLAGAAVSWRSAKQTLTATSTMEAEFVSCFEATSHGVWLKSFISALRVVDSISRPLRLYCDNSAAVFMAKNNKSRSRSKTHRHQIFSHKRMC
ncbi:secreted RxLR effector protein 161-like [Actinidia eriantha]|uniref:secreted RxLR effector protein 161-like n=1 Tax=Actinidia eriantha TaxID=165200 RepID=UPI00258C5A63|nr:secreted RxLR effector protein 161-like [Actinidia eriantha]